MKEKRMGTCPLFRRKRRNNFFVFSTIRFKLNLFLEYSKIRSPNRNNSKQLIFFVYLLIQQKQNQQKENVLLIIKCIQYTNACI